MPKPNVVPSLDETFATPSLEVLSPSKERTRTNWRALADAGLVPIMLDCQAYKPTHLADMSCHTHIRFNTDTIKRHIGGEHGGGFQLFVKRQDSKKSKESPLWEDLMNSGLEAADFKCNICHAEPQQMLRFSAAEILQHVKPHRGKTRQEYQLMLQRNPRSEGLLNITFAPQASAEVNEEDDEFFG